MFDFRQFGKSSILGRTDPAKCKESDFMNYKKSIVCFCILSLAILTCVFLASRPRNRDGGVGGIIMAKLRFVHNGQRMFRDRYGLYASSMDQLVAAGIMDVRWLDAPPVYGYVLTLESDGTKWSATYKREKRPRWFRIQTDGTIHSWNSRVSK